MAGSHRRSSGRCRSFHRRRRWNCCAQPGCGGHRTSCKAHQPALVRLHCPPTMAHRPWYTCCGDAAATVPPPICLPSVRRQTVAPAGTVLAEAAPSPDSSTDLEQYHAQCTTANMLTRVPACNATTQALVTSCWRLLTGLTQNSVVISRICSTLGLGRRLSGDFLGRMWRFLFLR